MIIIETKLKKIPETCTKCKFSEIKPIHYNGLGDYFTDHFEIICSITNKKVPYEFINERKNWCYTKCKKCPLKELDEN